MSGDQGTEEGLPLDRAGFGQWSRGVAPRVCDGAQALLPTVPAVGAGARDLVNGNLVQFNDNGTWSWYQDERALMDAMIIRSDNRSSSSSRQGRVRDS